MRLALFLLFTTLNAVAAISAVAHDADKAPAGGGNFTTHAMNLSNSGAVSNALVVVNVASATVGITLTDSSSNVWTPLVSSDNASQRSQLYYNCNATVTASQTFTITSGSTSFGSIYVESFSGAATSGCMWFQNHNSGNPLSNSINTGPVAVSVGDLIVAGLNDTEVGATYTIDTSMTITDQFSVVATQSYGGAIAWVISGGSGTVNPQWADTGSSANTMCASVAVFRTISLNSAIRHKVISQ